MGEGERIEPLSSMGSAVALSRIEWVVHKLRAQTNLARQYGHADLSFKELEQYLHELDSAVRELKTGSQPEAL
ncbi:MAG: hypothetical protein ACJ8A6_06100 [Gemmatimonadales bacterium]